MAFQNVIACFFAWCVFQVYFQRNVYKNINRNWIRNWHVKKCKEEEVRTVHKCWFDSLMCTEVAASFVSLTQYIYACTHTCKTVSNANECCLFSMLQKCHRRIQSTNRLHNNWHQVKNSTAISEFIIFVYCFPFFNREAKCWYQNLKNWTHVSKSVFDAVVSPCTVNVPLCAWESVNGNWIWIENPMCHLANASLLIRMELYFANDQSKNWYLF